METDAEMLELADAVLPGAMNYSLPSKEANGRSRLNKIMLNPKDGAGAPPRLMMTKFTLYETRTKMYIVGSNTRETRFRMLELDISDPRNKLNLAERSRTACTRSGIIEKLASLEEEHRFEGAGGGLHKRLTAWGILGFIKFTDIYYMCVITQRSVVAIIGGHYVYHIDATELVPIIHSSLYKRPDRHSEESRLLSTFQNLDLTKTFYFSQAYDLTNTLQYNLLREKVKAAAHNVEPEEEITMAHETQKQPQQPQQEQHVSFDAHTPKPSDSHNSSRHYTPEPTNNERDTGPKSAIQENEHKAGLTDGPNDRFVWNAHLLEYLKRDQVMDWCVAVIHGFIDQARIAIKGRNITVTIIARRSRHFAGARFLKRGANNQGDVANEVETEQIVCDNLTTSFHDARSGIFCSPQYTSYVQHRGSIPLFWSQDVSNMSPKPPIELNAHDPFYTAAALHFTSLFQRYGHPILVLNLIKKREHTPRESKLGAEFEESIEYLNQFLPEKDRIRYTAWDMSRASKARDQSVIEYLENYAEQTIQTTGIFHNGPLRQQKIQDGICRTNCIDCLDRTNAAQFVIGKKALGYQLKALGITDTVNIDYDSDAVNLLTEMYHDHGDTIALQYGGSHLVNTMETYRKINQWTSHSRDLIESIRRFYSNSFVDSQRQDAINLFLGNYVWEAGRPQLWDLASDFYLHNDFQNISNSHRSYTRWWVPSSLRSISTRLLSTDLVHFVEDDIDLPLLPYPGFMDNYWNDCYFPRVYTSFHRMFLFNMNSTLRYISTPLNISPFVSKRKGITGAITTNSKETADSTSNNKKRHSQLPQQTKSTTESIRHRAIKNASRFYIPAVPVPGWFSKSKDDENQGKKKLAKTSLMKRLMQDAGEGVENEEGTKDDGRMDSSSSLLNSTMSLTTSLDENQTRNFLPAYTSYFQGYSDSLFESDRHAFKEFDEELDLPFGSNHQVDPERMKVYTAFSQCQLQEPSKLAADTFMMTNSSGLGSDSGETFKGHLPIEIKEPDTEFYQKWLEV